MIENVIHPPAEQELLNFLREQFPGTIGNIKLPKMIHQVRLEAMADCCQIARKQALGKCLPMWKDASDAIQHGIAEAMDTTPLPK